MDKSFTQFGLILMKGFIFPNHFKELSPFHVWIKNVITSSIKEEDNIDKNMLHMFVPPTLEARSYRIMYVFGNHIHVSNAQDYLIAWQQLLNMIANQGQMIEDLFLQNWST
jgi:hypothetical protein